ncbi:MAG TPA: cbb3-type cytochrome oxidase assembly protein CcoS [Fibrobacteria bacterium]|nr:cbb3-type cytochrome oxidase assembly protein CcoS [Fibrobacteria bacterium]
MSVFAILIAGGVFLFLIFLALLVWSIRSGQLDDLETPAERALWDDPPGKPDDKS